MKKNNFIHKKKYINSKHFKHYKSMLFVLLVLPLIIFHFISCSSTRNSMPNTTTAETTNAGNSNYSTDTDKQTSSSSISFESQTSSNASNLELGQNGAPNSVQDQNKTSDSSQCQKNTNTSYSEAEQKAIIENFNKLIKEKAEPFVLINYIDENLKFASCQTMSIMLEGLEKVQNEYHDKYMWYLFEDNFQETLLSTFKTEQEFILKNIGKVKDESLKKEIIKIFNGGFKFVNIEGSYYPIIDFEYLKKYFDYIDQQYKDYIDIRATQSNVLYSRDAGLMITWDELAQRMLKTEDYLKKYPQKNSRRTEVGNLLINYFSAYIYGQNNTPTRDYETNIVYDEVIKSYKKTIENYPNYKAVKILKEYFNVLEKNNFVLSNEILNSLDKYINALIKEYDLNPA